MYAEIEEKIVERLEAQGLPARDIAIKSGKQGLRYPAAYVHIEEGKLERMSKESFKVTVNINLAIIFKKGFLQITGP